MQNLDMACLRTFVAIADAGTFAAAGERVGRTPPAVSLQVKRLEADLGTRLFKRDGRRMVLSEAGERLLGYARHIVSTNDGAVEALRTTPLSGTIRLGSVQDYADTRLADLLGRFRVSHPGVRLFVRVGRSPELVAEIKDGNLDLAIAADGWGGMRSEPILTEPMMWIGSPTVAPTDDGAVPLILFEAPCPFRDAALDALNKAGRRWEIVYTSPSLSGLRAAVRAGLGVTVRTRLFVEDSIADVGATFSLPRLPNAHFGLYTSGSTLLDAGKRLASLLTDQIRE